MPFLTPNACLAPTIAVVLLGATSIAQPQFFDDGFVAVPPGVAAATITRLDSGRINDDIERDAVLLVGSMPCFVPSVSTHDDFLALSATVANDIAVAHGASPSGWDGIAVVGAAGLERLDWVGAGGVTFQSVSVDSGSAWQNAVIVRCANLDAAGNDDYFGVGPDLRTIIVRIATAGSSTSFTVPFDVLAIMAVRWDPDAPLELAVLTPGEVRIHEQGGALKERFIGNGTSGDSFAVVKTPGATRDRICWIDKSTGGAQILRILKPGQMENGGDLSAHAPSEDFFGVESGDIDLDGDDDLTIARRSSYDPLFLPNIWPSAPMFVAPAVGSTPTYVPTNCGAVPPIVNYSVPHSDDFDGDLDPDLLIAAGNVNRLCVIHGLATPDPPPEPTGGFPEEYPQTGTGGGHPVQIAAGSQMTLSTSGQPIFKLRFEPDPDAISTTEYDLIVFKQTLTSPGNPVLENGNVGYYRCNFDGVDPASSNTWTAEFALASENDLCFQTLYWFKLVRVASPVILASESQVFSFSCCTDIVWGWTDGQPSIAFRLDLITNPACDGVPGLCPPLGIYDEGFSPGPSTVVRQRLPPRQTPGSNPTPNAPLPIVLAPS